MSHNEKKTYGITSPISLSGPAAKDIILTQKLLETIEPFGVFESQAEVNKRLEVLGKLNELVVEFVKNVSVTKVS